MRSIRAIQRWGHCSSSVDRVDKDGVTAEERNLEWMGVIRKWSEPVLAVYFDDREVITTNLPLKGTTQIAIFGTSALFRP